MKLKYNVVETPRVSLLSQSFRSVSSIFISANNNEDKEDLSLQIESFAKTNFPVVSTKLYFNLIFTMQTYKELEPFNDFVNNRLVINKLIFRMRPHALRQLVHDKRVASF